MEAGEISQWVAVVCVESTSTLFPAAPTARLEQGLECLWGCEMSVGREPQLSEPDHVFHSWSHPCPTAAAGSQKPSVQGRAAVGLAYESTEKTEVSVL